MIRYFVLQTSRGTFPVVDGNGSFVGTLDRANILQSVKQAGPDARVADAMAASPVLTVGCRATLEQALRLMQRNSATAVGITDAAGKLVGFVTSEAIAEMMTLAMLQNDRPGGPPLAWRSRPSGMGRSHGDPDTRPGIRFASSLERFLAVHWSVNVREFQRPGKRPIWLRVVSGVDP